MNKTTKKIMALILSLVMLFGYIPCNIANASGETKTLGELLATISFPTTEGTGWISERGNIAHIDSENGELKLIPWFNQNEFKTIPLSKEFELSGQDYVANLNFDSNPDDKETKVTICMQDSKITGIVVNNTFNFAGTYTPDNDFRKLVKAVYRTEPSGDSEWFTITDNGDERTIILKKDYKLESSLVFLNGKKTILDLNGHILDRGLVNPNGTFTKAEHGSVIEINNNTSIINTTLEIKDSAPDTPHKGTINSKGLWYPNEAGDVIIKGGVITGGTGTKKRR